MLSRGLIVVILSAVLLALPASAVQPDEVLPDPALEARARALSLELRCLVCQNQSIDDSNAPLARDLRLLVRERLKTGETDSQVLSYIVARYGEFVLLRPPFGWHTALLWLTPLVVLGTAIVVIGRRTRHGPGAGGPAPAPLTAAEEARLRQILDGVTKPSAKS